MKTIFLFCAVVFPCLAVGQSPQKAQIARGRYLATRVAMCGDCHTPYDHQGNLVKAQWLKGAPLSFKPLAPMPWAPAAPAIAGLPAWTNEEVTTFLMTGKMKGTAVLPPMPSYRMSERDAQAVTAYLRSLGVSAKPERATGATK
jgi:mono/diheme cytochrome c family protein